jgi:hypothetical protein
VKRKVYLETSVISYLTAWPSRDLLVAAHQQITHDWWRNRRQSFDLFISATVIDEVSAGDAQAAAERLAVLQDLPIFEADEDALRLAQTLVQNVPLPPQAGVDSVHIALAVVNGMDYLLTWNCRHIANAALRGRVEEVCRSQGYKPPIICTPEELLSEE